MEEFKLLNTWIEEKNIIERVFEYADIYLKTDDFLNKELHITDEVKFKLYKIEYHMNYDEDLIDSICNPLETIVILVEVHTISNELVCYYKCVFDGLGKEIDDYILDKQTYKLEI